MGYLCLSVSIPAYTTPPNRSFKMAAKASALSIPCKAPTNTVLLGSSLWDGLQTKLLSAKTQGITCTWKSPQRFISWQLQRASCMVGHILCIIAAVAEAMWGERALSPIWGTQASKQGNLIQYNLSWISYVHNSERKYNRNLLVLQSKQK